MNETVFDAYGFTEVLAVVSKPSPAWVKIRRKDGGVITAAEAFEVGGSTGDEFIFESNLGVVKSSSDNIATNNVAENHGPFFIDAYGEGNGWMWTTHNGVNDARKGSFPGATTDDMSNVWQWYGRTTIVRKRINSTNTKTVSDRLDIRVLVKYQHVLLIDLTLIPGLFFSF